MRASNIILTLAALATTASAFFPFYPDYRCAETQDCVEAKGTSEGVVVGRDGGLTLKLVQRLPVTDGAPINRIRQLGERLMRKYQGSTVKKDIGKRTNTYPIMPAATPAQASSAGINQDGTDFSYFAQVLLGSKNVPMYVLLDTGAGSSWVMGSTCTSGPCSIHNLYDASTSTTYKQLGQSFSVQYGSGSVSGTQGTEDLTLAGLKIPTTVSIVNSTSNDFNNFPMDGILGLSLTKSDNPSFIDSLIASKALKSNIFGMSLNRASDGPNTGEINFGAVDTSRFSGDLSYTAVSSAAGGFWAIPMANAGFGTTQSGITTKLAYIDTGTSFIFAPPSDAKIFHSIIPGASSTDGKFYHVPCTTTASLTFTFGSTTFSVSPKDWISQPNNGVCTSNVFGQEVIAGQWLLGDTFLKNVYAVFDADQSRVGFAAKAAATTAPSSTGMPSSTAGTLSTTVSNGLPPGTVATGTSATFTASTLLSVTSGATTPPSSAASPGFNGHETDGSTSASAEAQTTSTNAKPTSAKSSGLRLQSGVSFACFGFFLALIT